MPILDWFKEIPLSAVLKEKLLSLERENIELKARIVDLEAKITDLHIQIESHKISLENCEENRRTLEKQITEEHNNPLIFDDKTGTWVSDSTMLRYCAKCKSQNALSPLKIEAYGWHCNSCNTSFNDPDRPKPKYSPTSGNWKTS